MTHLYLMMSQALTRQNVCVKSRGARVKLKESTSPERWMFLMSGLGYAPKHSKAPTDKDEELQCLDGDDSLPLTLLVL